MRVRKFLFFVLLALASGLLPQNAHAQSISTQQALSFGQLLIRNNNSAHTVTVSPNGSTSYASGIMSVQNAVPGIYDLLGLIPDSDVSITISPPVLTLTCGCGGPDFTLDNFTISPATPHTDGVTGNTTFRLGATLHTSGTSATYIGVNYTGTMTVEINN